MVSATASNADLGEEVGFMPGAHDRPARMIDVVGAYCADIGVSSIGLSARVPHYVETSAFPAAGRAPRSAERGLPLKVDTASLRRESERTRKQLDELIAESEEYTTMVRQLEAQHDAATATIIGDDNVPTGNKIAEGSNGSFVVTSPEVPRPRTSVRIS